MPTLRTRLVRAGFVAALQAVRRTAGGVPLGDAPEEELREYALGMRAQLETLSARLPTGRTVRFREADECPVAGLWVADGRALPPVGDDQVSDLGCDTAERVVLHLHGGAYVMGSPRTHRGLAAALSRTAHAQVLLPDYRLAPEDVHPAALDDALAVYRWLVEERAYPAARIAVTGDSAGGGLGLGLLFAARDAGLPLPACYVGLSPWTDLAGTGGSVRELDGIDPWLSTDLLVPAARAYAGTTDLEDPMVSPLYGDLVGLPPVLVHVGSDEILRDDAVRLVERAREAGVDASLGIFDGLWHVFQAFPLPESRSSLREVGAFIRRQTTADTRQEAA
ncbi:alpha/beta hydrolase [Nitriliruptor alkaliphilus]|uniref:alpha/beta hydrolase n=1 Tax=Nitriliruptor alkaliphilus TaxID=427918 RepID=UPI0006991011|nr:alpha/beta hydrolase [Nitriliruptor alkaliphilus]